MEKEGLEPQPPHMSSVPVVYEGKAAQIQGGIALIGEGVGRRMEGRVRGLAHQ